MGGHWFIYNSLESSVLNRVLPMAQYLQDMQCNGVEVVSLSIMCNNTLNCAVLQHDNTVQDK